jgi:hypothetical protein
LGVNAPESMTGSDFWSEVEDIGELHDFVVTGYGPYAALRNNEWVFTTRYAREGSMGRAETHPDRLSSTKAELDDVSGDHPELVGQLKQVLTERLQSN